MRGTVGTVIIVSVALQGFAWSSALAQSPVPLQRSMDYAPLQAKVAEQAVQPQQAPIAPPVAPAAPVAVNKDRFGNVVRGTTCAEDVANCAFDPTRPPRQ